VSYNTPFLTVHLTVQSKVKDIIDLEPEYRTWNRLLVGLRAGQLSFLIRAGADCLPTPLNLHRWGYRVSNSCPLCNSPSPTTAHILNGSQEALTQGRYTWRHDSVLNCITSLVSEEVPPNSKLYQVFELMNPLQQLCLLTYQPLLQGLI